MTLFPNTETICDIKDPLHWTSEKSKLMLNACREMALFHQGHCPDIAYLYKKYDFDPRTLQAEEDLARIPALGVTAMKYFLLTSLPAEQSILKLTSSGTRGQKTQIWFDQKSLDRCQAMLERYWEQEGFISDQPTNYLMFVYDPKDAKDLGVTFSDSNQQRFAPVAESFYTIRKEGSGEWKFNLNEVIEKTRQFAEIRKPVRIFGLPAFVFSFLEELGKHKPIPLPPGSMIMVGGGWKAAENKKVSREEFRLLATERLGIPDENIRDNYGMAEHCAPYMECRKHRFHIGAYNRIIVRDPITYHSLPPGEIGLLELITPWNAMMPNLAVLSTDLGKIDPEPCGCGWNSPTFTLVGRAGLSKHKGCAIHADDIVKRGKST